MFFNSDDIFQLSLFQTSLTRRTSPAIVRDWPGLLMIIISSFSSQVLVLQV